MNTCSKCGKSFTLYHNKVRHEKFCKLDKKHECCNCHYKTSRVDNLRRHELVCKNKINKENNDRDGDVATTSNRNKILKPNKDKDANVATTSNTNRRSFMHSCGVCGRLYKNVSRFRNHLNIHNMTQENNNLENDTGTITLSESALNGHARVYDVTPSSTVLSIDDFLNSMRHLLGSLVENLQSNFHLRGRLIAQIQYVRSDPENNETFLAHFTSSSSNYIYDFNSWIEDNINSLNSHVETFKNKGSNWIINKIMNVEFNVITTPLLQGGQSFPLPQKLKKF